MSRRERRVAFLGTGRPQVERFQEGWLEHLIERLPDVTFRYRLGPTSGFDFVSPSAETLTGYTPEQFSTMPNLLELFVTPEEIASASSGRDEPAGEGPWGGRLERRDGSVVAVERWWVPIRDETGALTALEGFVRQVADGVFRNDRPVAPSSTTGDRKPSVDVVHMMAHDLHQSIVTAQVYAGILQRALQVGDLPRAVSSARVIESAIEQLDEMTRNVVDGILSDGSALPLVPERLDLAAVVAQIVSDLSAAREIDSIRCEAPEPTLVDADPRHLNRILDNILTNALKYSEPGSHVIARVENRGDWARISIADRGIGISPDDLPRLFQCGFRGRNGSRRSPGLGLGLYIARFLVEAHGGRIWAESTLGQGSTFYVDLRSARNGN